MDKPKWRATALAIATAVLLGMSASDASALALGPVTVQSALGEPLRARIDIPEINAEELASLRVAIASAAAYRTAGLEYSAAVSAITVKLESRPNGRPYLSVSSSRPMTEPFLDLLLETSWASGRIVRDYTMLFDPPALRQNTPPVAAQVSPAPRSTALPPATPSTPAPAPAAAAAPNAVAPKAAASSAAAERPVAVPKTPAGEAKQLTVKSGDTAGRIAAANKPANVSLDQMLVAMLRANPDAFIGGNVNRLKSGAVLDVPKEEDAALVPSDEARQTLVAQSRDFNEFRRKLAEALPTTPTAEADRQAKGKVQVEEKKSAAPTPDKLTLSKGAVQAKGGEDKIARDRAAQDAAARVAELDKNINELNKLGKATAPAAGASSATTGLALPAGPAAAIKPSAPAPAPAIAPAAPVVKAPEMPAPVAATTPAPAAVAPVPAASAAAAVGGSAMAVTTVPEAPAVAASAAATESPAVAASPATSAPAAIVPAPAASAARAKPLPAPAEASMMDELLDNPMVPVAAGGILALLLGFGFYRIQQRKKSAQVDSSFLESRLQPDSFFGASGGQRVDTAEAAATGSSMVYSPSQLDAAGDVDPVAEADVYLAYGRDLQAEEILKEAMRTTPQRVAIHGKLLEIYAKRRDTKAFELVAAEAYSLTRGEGPEWEHICGLGQELDASNPLYRPGGQPARAAGAGAAAGAAAAVPVAASATQPMPMDTAAAIADIDLDLDFSVGDDSAPAAAPAPAAAARPAAVEPARPAPAPAPVAELLPSLDMDFESTGAPAEPHGPELTLGNDSLSFTAEPAKTPAPAPAASRPAATPAVAPAVDGGMIEFDLGALSLDLDPPVSAAPAAATAAAQTTGGASAEAAGGDMSNDPLATKLALAQEFNAIGDPDGARSLAQEVLAEASGDLKSRAQRFLAEIS